ncbi:MAG: bifunctional alpha,alpha-trehalose-phosphate synthase (UDP-forming)/trehalose-phosphatase [Phaeodactylibacter sp.]|nr:bifunctional alpha,alpha-trehalose-phosphate synthase (UDP-forming)/trehalose-phosphatase [Phaeodactylibacter sp.]MCB9297270.1 bifunctional alpha,alpha-trehalose-phosphate synthase (UDP-forming)/trehalose-phosphatase [Lewinellaceae bacterium]
MKIQVVSNRLPLEVEIKKDKGEISAKPASGGLATGLSGLRQAYDMVWTGWPGSITSSARERAEIERFMAKRSLFPVWLSKKDYNGYYKGFSNKVIWPLFHYFCQYPQYRQVYWKAYVKANLAFCNRILENASEEDIFWINDYHLMLLPEMIRENLPHAKIGFFLHIPFPHFEVFRQLPWRKEILEGLAGAGLIGFHTQQYADYFLHCVNQILGCGIDDGTFEVKGRTVRAGSFPMGIDYQKFTECARQPDVISTVRQYREEYQGKKIILSVDRLDYSKGIIQRLRGFDRFLENNPAQRGKIALLELIVPSRVGVEQYRQLKKEIDEFSGKINGKYGTPFWTPVRYFYRSVDFPTLCGLYYSADIALITPRRDGMNLVAKEYVAVHQGQPGVLILSEFAGAAQQLRESITVNPNSIDAIAQAIEKALDMPVEEQTKRLEAMQKVIRKTDVKDWAAGFIEKLRMAAARTKSTLES